MKTIRDVMTPNVVWVSPTQQAKTAIILMKGHGIDALPVIYTHDSVVGMLYASSLLGQDMELPVVDLMDTDFTIVPPEMPVFEAGEMMTTDGKSHLLVVEDGKLAGIVSRSNIISELGKSYDTLTRLPWQDAFREWSINALDRGREISVILIDLNLFGKFNKRYGHVMGDNVLKAVAEALKVSIDPDRDFLCRYAGDEFSVASYRPANEAMDFGRRLIEAIESIEIPGLPEKIGATFGMAGGRRANGRVQIHSAATLDDLITNASLNCTISKPHRPEAATTEAAPEVQPQVSYQAAPTTEPYAPSAVRRTPQTRLKIQTIRLSTTTAETTVEIILAKDDIEYAHSATGFSTGGRPTLRLVAEAAAGAATKSLAGGHGVVIEDVVLTQTTDERQLVTVIATFITPAGTTTHAGSALVRRSDPYRAAAAALLSAINRQIVLAPPTQAVVAKG